MSTNLELTEEQLAALARGATRAGMEMQAFLVTCALKVVQQDEVAQADTLAFLTDEARRAVAEAQSKLHEKGIGYVTGDETSVQKHLPSTKEKV